jgi:cobalamin biosynthesis Co2+ chelatase CbiK
MEVNNQNIEEILNDEDINKNSIENTNDVDYNNTQENKDIFYLPEGNALNEEQLYLLSSRKNVELIFLVGPVGSGKTTIEVMSYQIFLCNTFKNLLFAGSLSLKGFEERAINMRTISGKSNPDMERTPINVVNKYLHLGIKNIATNNIHNLLLTDISGEEFENCCNNSDLMSSKFKNLQLAKSICFVLDGERLIDIFKRNAAISQVMQFIQTIFDAKLVKNNTLICILLTKYDIVEKVMKNDPSLKEFIEKIEEKINKKFGMIQGISVYFQKVSAVNDIKKIDKDNSILELIDKWIKSNDSLKIQSIDIYSNNDKKLANEFNRFGLKNERCE